MNLHKQLFTGLFLALMVSASAEIKVTSLTTDYKSNPIGIGNPAPMLSWIIQSDQYNTMQDSYEIRAAADPRDLSRGKNLIWDSGKISSQQSVHIKYGSWIIMARKAKGAKRHSGRWVSWRMPAGRRTG